MKPESYVLTVRCKDEPGIVAAVVSALTANGAFITESSHYSEGETGQFSMRAVFHVTDGGPPTLADFREALEPMARRYEMQLGLHAAAPRARGMLAVSRDSPCLDHLLHHWHSGELPVDIVCVVSDQHDLRRFVEWYDIAYRRLPAADNVVQEA